MASWASLHLLFLVVLVTTSVHGDKFQVRWFNNNNNFRAGDTASVMVKLEGVHGVDNNHGDTELNRFKIILNGEEGNSTFISGVGIFHDAVLSTWNITFVPILVGSYLPVIEDRHTGLLDTSLNFSVSPGDIYPSVCVGFWTNYVNEFTAGEVAKVSILPKDAFGNNITQANNEDPSLYKFVISMVNTNGSSSDLSKIFYKGLDGLGYIGLEFKVVTSGNFTLYIIGGNQTLDGFPLPFSVVPGPLDMAKCSATGNYEANALQIFSNLEVFIYQKDQFDNVVSGQYDFDVGIVEKATNLSLPVSDLQFKEAGLGIQLLTFSVSEPGDFVLTIYDAKDKGSAFSIHYHYTVFIGYTHGLNSVVNGSALSGSVAGEVAYLSVYLHDIYFNPSPIEVQWLRVVIIKKSDSSRLRAMVAPIPPVGEREPAVGIPYLTGDKPLDPFTTKNISSVFSVMYNPVKSGSYDIWVFCGNIPLNGGRPYTVEVSPYRVDTSASRVLTYASKVLRLVRNEVTVQLMDRVSNPVTSQQSKLSFDFGFAGGSLFLNWSFENRGDGTYLGYYLAKDTGVFNISVLFDGEKLASCPFEINAYRKEYFPEAVNDTITVWENQSIAFNVLENDHFPVGNRSIVNFSLPHHGSLIHQEHLFRYTPYKGFFGNDSFSYSISDVNMNIATGTVTISVLICPPQFVSLPSQLIATEDKISLRFSGSDGFEIKYSDPSENILIHLRSEHGRMYFAPSPMQFWKPRESEFSISNEQEGKDLILVGRVQVLNYMLRLIQYLGDENFHGADNITFTMKNKHGEQFGLVPIFVKPINDPPFILVPEYIILEDKDGTGYSKLFNRDNQGEQIVGDPDYMNFPGDKSEFVVRLSIEVNAGLVMTTLPAYLINTTELILESKYHWQPLLAFVAISKQVVIRGKGIRFYCTLVDCNNVLQQLKFEGAGQAVLTISVNDLGNYGCYFECLQDMSLPLQTQATINLIRTRPMKSSVARLLGSMIIIEFIAMILLGFSLLLFICKCARSLGYERSSPPSSEIMLSDAQNFDKTVVQVDSEIQNGRGNKDRNLSEHLSGSYWIGEC